MSWSKKNTEFYYWTRLKQILASFQCHADQRNQRYDSGTWKEQGIDIRDIS